MKFVSNFFGIIFTLLGKCVISKKMKSLTNSKSFLGKDMRRSDSIAAIMMLSLLCHLSKIAKECFRRPDCPEFPMTFNATISFSFSMGFFW